MLHLYTSTAILCQKEKKKLYTNPCLYTNFFAKQITNTNGFAKNKLLNAKFSVV
jgi:hypothetical protein